ncbi:MAG: N-acetylneuraminate synthase family protein [Armatimonadetes bacterium]|nr:N-acetylneuraminate synthase family protein [Armatimonadota bacterium]
MALIIAEFCQNHNGKIDLLKEMIYSAAEAGADYAKIQTIFVEDLTYRAEFEEAVYNKNGKQLTFKRPYFTEYERLKTLELDYKLHAFFIDECNKIGIKPLTTIFSRKRIFDLQKLGFKAVKIASYDCGSFPLIEDIKDKFFPLFISTGASFEEEIRRTASILKGREFYFLHCVTIYPTPLNLLNLRKMEFLRQFTSLVGFSDHSLTEKDGLKASLSALVLGAGVIERHFSILGSEQTKDGAISIDKTQLKKLCRYAKMDKNELLELAKKEAPEFKFISEEKLKLELSPEEILNRNYYKGRFASKAGEKYIYNWESAPLKEII